MYKSAKILVLSGCIAIAGLLHLCPRESITPDHSRYYWQLCPHVKQPHVHPRRLVELARRNAAPVQRRGTLSRVTRETSALDKL